jgi:hypothetical protein
MGYSAGKYLFEIDFQKRIFRLSTPVFSGDQAQAFVRFFSNLSSTKTTLLLEKNSVIFCKELPFVWGPQPTLRQQVYAFLRYAKKCRHHLSRLAYFEKMKDVQVILES